MAGDSGSADALAHQVAQGMYARDVAARETMGIEILEAAEGRAVLRMVVHPLHLNGHAVCHGGFVFTLADTAFAYACNSRNKVTLAASAMIDFLKPSREGDVLTCTAAEQWTEGRHGVYNMTVANQRGEVVALFRGKSAQIGGSVIPE
ncbi:MAG: putative phenylacetic acid degradation protein [Pseudomonadota bacterium]|jgi:acyl-CoA thioesterase